MASLLVLSTACGDDSSPSAEGDSSSTGTNSTTTGPTPTPPADSSTTDSTATDSTTADSTTTDSTTTDGPGTTSGSSSDGGSSSSGGEGSSSSDGEGSSSSSDGGGSSSSSGSSTTAADPCDAGDGPDFTVTNSGAVDYVIDGVNDPALVVVRGCSYTFDVSAPGHPFFIKTAAVTGVGSAYNDGVANNGTSSGLITWDVPMAAPDALFYICEFHASMVGSITVVDP